ncbi:MAG: LysE family translocator [Halobacteriales archaeon]
MAFDLASVLAGVVFGLALAVPPGPMNAIIAEQSVTRGWRSGFAAGLGAMTADVIFFALAIVGMAAVVEEVAGLETLLYVAGGLLMLRFAFDAFAAMTSTQRVDVETTGATGFQKALILGLTNPFQLGFWLTVGVALVRPGQMDLGGYVPLVAEFVVETGGLSLLGGFFAGIVIWISAYPATLVAVGARVDRFEPIVALGSGIVLAGFGLLFCWIGLSGLL